MGADFSTRSELLRRAARGAAALVVAGSLPVGEAAAGDRLGKTVHLFYSRLDLRPPILDVVHPASPGATPGLLFLAPNSGPGQSGPLILHDSGQVVWFKPTSPLTAFGFRVQRYRGEPVLTWWEGSAAGGYGTGEYVIADASYRELARFGAGNHRGEDEHEFLLTPEGTALITSWEKRTMSLASIGGRRNATVIGGVVQELELPSGRLLFEWRSLDHVDVAESRRSVQQPFDYFHVNSIDVAPDGDLLVSARNTWAVYKIARKTGRIVWRLGGVKSDFRLGPGATFAWQHDARMHSGGSLMSVFDNAVGPGRHHQSRAIVLALDEQRRRATLARAFTHSPALYARALGSAQRLDDGGYLVGWGTEPYVTEYAPDGTVRYDARLPYAGQSYRAFRFPWTAAPADPPTLRQRTVDRTKVYASWNGATEVASWQLRAGASADALRDVAVVPSDAFETALALPSGVRHAVAVALDRHGRALGTSPAIAV